MPRVYNKTKWFFSVVLFDNRLDGKPAQENAMENRVIESLPVCKSFRRLSRLFFLEDFNNRLINQEHILAFFCPVYQNYTICRICCVIFSIVFLQVFLTTSPRTWKKSPQNLTNRKVTMDRNSFAFSLLSRDFIQVLKILTTFKISIR